MRQVITTRLEAETVQLNLNILFVPAQIGKQSGVALHGGSPMADACDRFEFLCLAKISSIRALGFSLPSAYSWP